MNKGVQVAVTVLGVSVVLVGGVVVWANLAVSSRMAATYDVHEVDFPVPWPLSEAELDELRAEKRAELAAAMDETEALDAANVATDLLEGIDLDELARDRALERGKHLVEARFACIECHGQDFSGGTMVDDPVMATWLGPNLTAGEGLKVVDYDVADWDAIVRHGVKPDGTAAIMPSEDFVGMSDQELSDIIVYVSSFPAIDNTVAPIAFGPVGLMLTATGALPLSADRHAGTTEHAELPPEAEATAVFGAHLAQVCSGCHRPDLSGGPIAAGPPSWPAAANLTMHADGLEGWTFEQFDALMRTGKRPDGTTVAAPMDLMMPYAQQNTDVEMAALWAYIQSMPPVPTGE